jgi:DNA (cytosine-5)-methyltransferase 1
VKSPKFIDLFAGCGGLSLGLSEAGWRGIFAVERDPMAFQTLHENLVKRRAKSKTRFTWPKFLPEEPLQIQALLKDHLLVLRRQHGKVDLIAGGPPCQGFSSAGKRNGSDPRNQMLLHYVQTVHHVRPKFILMENVQGIASKHQGEAEAYADVLFKKLHEIEYLCVSRVVKAAEHGVPQERPRFILLGVDKRLFPGVDAEELGELWNDALEAGREQLFEKLSLPKRTVTCQEAISDLETRFRVLEPCPDAPGRKQLRYGQARTTYQRLLHGSTTDMDSMRLAKHSPATITRFNWIQDQYDRGVNIGRLELGEFGTKKHSQAVLNPDRPSRTLTTLPDDLIHYSEPRILTVREYARIQSFPDWFKFYGKYTTGGHLRTKECPRYTQVGNAVAPFVGQALGYAVRHLAKALARSKRGSTSGALGRPASAAKSPTPQKRGTNGIRVWRAGPG